MGVKGRERSTEASYQLVCAFWASNKVMKSSGRGQGCIHIGTSVALLTFTAWLVILKEDRVRLM